MRASLLAALNRARETRRACALVTPLAGGVERLVFAEDAATDPLAPVLEERLRSGRSGRVRSGGDDLFVRVYLPSPRLTVVGAVHVAQVLAPMAVETGFDVTILDPREAFATAERFGACRVVAQWPDREHLELDGQTAVATLTHDPKIDDPALVAALEAGCFYVGALGSRKTHARRMERLTAAGVPVAALERIRAPIGLPIGAATPAEIAVSILAEIVAALRLEPAAAAAAAHTPAPAA